jgi:putative redox protein
MPRNVAVGSGTLKSAQTVAIGPHAFHSDEPSDGGGNDTSPNAHELLIASLGACANMTVRMYAERHQYPLN